MFLVVLVYVHVVDTGCPCIVVDPSLPGPWQPHISPKKRIAGHFGRHHRSSNETEMF